MKLPQLVLSVARLIKEVGKLKEHVASVEKQEGPKGEQGVQGPQGERGPQGPTGVQGPAGRDGVVGKDGRDGERGPAGPQGKAGPKGEKGERGLQGEAGEAGASVEKLELVGGVLYAYINGEKTEAGRLDSTQGGVVWNAGIGGFPDANSIPNLSALIAELIEENEEVAANTNARHDAVSVTDTPEINLTLSGQDISANINAGSVTKSMLDSDVGDSLDLADSSLQTSDIGTSVQAHSSVLDSTTASYTTTEETKLSSIETGAEVNNISDSNATDLTDGGDSSLHFHASDRARANHTGTQTASTISDFDTEVSNNTDVAANTSYRTVGHVPNSAKGAVNGVATLDGGGKIPASQLPSSVMEYLGTWNAATNTPSLADGSGDNGDVYLVTTAGSQNLGSGSISFSLGDWAVYNGSVWQKSLNSDSVVSVNSQTGVVVIDADDIDDSSTTHKFATQSQLDKADSAVQENDSPTFNNISVSGTVDGRDIASDGNKLDNIEANADVTDTANVVAALSEGSNITIEADGTISSANTQLSDEQVQDIVGAMVTGNTETGITVTYKDSDGTLDFSVASQTDENFTTADHAKLDGIEAGATTDQTKADIDALGINADQVDGLDASQFLRSDVSDILDVGRGNVHLENNSNDNQNGSGITIRSASNPSSGSESSGSVGSIFAVRSSGQACRLWVGQSETTTGSNDFVTNDAQFDGDISVTSNTASTSTTTGSIQTDGGLGVAKDTHIGGSLEVEGDELLVSGTAASLRVDNASGRSAVFGDDSLVDKYIQVRDSAGGLNLGIDADEGVGIQAGSNKSFRVKVNSSADTFNLTDPQFKVKANGDAEFTQAVRIKGRVGVVEMKASNNLPVFALWCDGSAVSRTTYADLFAEIGTTWGAGNGSTTFNLPNLNGGRFPRGNSTAGGTGGSANHTHQVNPPSTTTNTAGAGSAGGLFGGGAGGAHSHTVDIPTFTSGSASNLPPYANIKYFIWY